MALEKGEDNDPRKPWATENMRRCRQQIRGTKEREKKNNFPSL